MDKNAKYYVIMRLAVITVLTLIFLLLIPSLSKADSYASFMLGEFHSADKSPVEVKFVNIGIRKPLALGLTQQMEVGGWTDSGGNGRKGSAYGAYQVGVEVDSFILARFMAGPAFISTPDTYLGASFPQFTEELFLGLCGKNNNTVGLKYKHVSSAGLIMPNMGRDMIGIEASLPW